MYQESHQFLKKDKNHDNHDKIKKLQEKSIINSIEKNAYLISKNLEKLTEQDNVDTIELTHLAQENKFELTEEEQKICDQVRILVKSKTPEIKNIDEEFLEFFENDITSSRKGYYGDENEINWKSIITDVIKILEPNLSKNKNEVIETYKYILDLNSRLEKKELEIKETIKEIEMIEKQINEIIEKRKGMLRHLDNLTDNQKMYYENICDYLKKGDNEAAQSCADSISEPIEKFEYLNILKDLIDCHDLIKTYLDEKYIDKESYEMFKEETNKLIEKEKQLNVKIDQHLENMYEHNQLQEIKTYQPVQTLIYYMIDDLNTYTEEQNMELEEVTKYLINKSWQEIRKDDKKHFIEPVYRMTISGKREYYKSDEFEVYRAWGRPGTRTGLIKIKICEEIQKKIFDRYNIENIGSLIIATDVINVKGQDHNQYKKIIASVEGKRKEIMNLVNLMANPNTEEKIVFEIIDKSLKMSNKIANRQFEEQKTY